MDHSNHVRLSEAELNPANLKGPRSTGRTTRTSARVSHVHGAGGTAQVVIDVGGFLGIAAKPVAVPASQLDFMRDEDGDIHVVTSWTEDQLKDMPEHRD